MLYLYDLLKLFLRNNYLSWRKKKKMNIFIILLKTKGGNSHVTKKRCPRSSLVAHPSFLWFDSDLTGLSFYYSILIHPPPPFHGRCFSRHSRKSHSSVSLLQFRLKKLLAAYWGWWSAIFGNESPNWLHSLIWRFKIRF